MHSTLPIKLVTLFSLSLFACGVILEQHSFSGEKVAYKIKSKGSKIYFNERSNLSPDDFKLRKKLPNGHSAISKLALDVIIYHQCDTFNSNVHAVFLKNGSYLNKSALQSNKLNLLINHENGHFAIAAIHAMKLEFKLDSLLIDINRKGVDLPVSNVNRIYRNIDRLHYLMHKDYDSDTKHGILINQQNLWDSILRYQVDSLSVILQTR